MTFDEVERGYFERLAARHRRVKDAADEAGMTRHSLSRRLRKLAISLMEDGHEYAAGLPGEVSSYNRGCRCPDCKAARSAYQRQWYRKMSREKFLEARDGVSPF